MKLRLKPLDGKAFVLDRLCTGSPLYLFKTIK